MMPFNNNTNERFPLLGEVQVEIVPWDSDFLGPVGLFSCSFPV